MRNGRTSGIRDVKKLRSKMRMAMLMYWETAVEIPAPRTPRFSPKFTVAQLFPGRQHADNARFPFAAARAFLRAAQVLRGFFRPFSKAEANKFAIKLGFWR